MMIGRHKPVLALGILLAIGFALMAWRSGQPDCFVGDSVAVIDQAPFDGRALWLVHRTTGFHDKVEFVEIYAGAPVFDACGRASLEPIGVDHYDETQGLVKALAIRNDGVALVYTRNAAEATVLAQLKLPRK